MATPVLLSLADIRQIVAHVGLNPLMDKLIDVLSGAFAAYAPAHDVTPTRSGFAYTEPVNGLIEWMPARQVNGKASLKIVSYHPGNPSTYGLASILSTIACFDTYTGQLLGIADATFLTALRTGAASAIATRVLASPRTSRCGLIGAGAQACTQLHAISRVVHLREVWVYDSDPEAARSFGNRVAPLGLDARIRIADPQEVVANSDVLCTCTSNPVGAGAVFRDAGVASHLHVNAVGSDFAGKMEIPASLLQRALVCPDFRDQAVREGECQQLDADEVGPDITVLVKRSRDFADNRHGLTVFDSTGWALEDHVSLELLLSYAQELGLGSPLNRSEVSRDPLDPYAFLEVGQSAPVGAGRDPETVSETSR